MSLEHGELCVMMAGTITMQELSVDNLDSWANVSIEACALNIGYNYSIYNIAIHRSMIGGDFSLKFSTSSNDAYLEYNHLFKAKTPLYSALMYWLCFFAQQGLLYLLFL